MPKRSLQTVTLRKRKPPDKLYNGVIGLNVYPNTFLRHNNNYRKSKTSRPKCLSN